MINFILGFLAGGFFGVLTISLCVISGRNNDAEEKILNGDKQNETYEL